MTAENIAIPISIEWWQEYHQMLRQAVAPLTDEQLDLRPRPDLRSVGEIAAHIVVARSWYLYGVMSEGDAAMEPLVRWDRAETRPHTVAELLRGFDQTWQLLVACFARWTAADMRDSFFINWLDAEAPRDWIMWHVLEHEIHHGGELSFTLGGSGLVALAI